MVFLILIVVVFIWGVVSVVNENEAVFWYGSVFSILALVFCVALCFCSESRNKYNTDIDYDKYDITVEDFELQKDVFDGSYLKCDSENAEGAVYYWRNVNGELKQELVNKSCLVILNAEATNARLYHRTDIDFNFAHFFLTFETRCESKVLVVGTQEEIEAWHNAHLQPSS